MKPYQTRSSEYPLMKKIQINIGAKIGIVISLVTVMILLTSVIISYNFNKEVVVTENLNKLNLLVDYQEQIIKNTFEETDQDLKLVQEYDLVRDFVKAIENENLSPEKRLEKRKELSKKLLSKIEEYHDYEDIIITNIEGKKYFQQSDLSLEQEHFRHHLNIRIAKFYNDRLIVEGSNAYTYASRPLLDNDSLIGIIVCKIDLVKLLIEQTEISSFFDAATINYSFKKKKEVKTFTITSNQDIKPTVKRIRDQDDPTFLSARENKGQGFFGSHLGVKSLTVYRPLKLVNIGITASVPKSEIFTGLNQHFNTLLLEILVLLFLTICLTAFLIKNIGKGLKPIKNAIRSLNRGAFPEPIPPKRSNDEFEQLGIFLNQHVRRLIESAEFAHKIGNGDLQKGKYEPISEEDTLGLELLRMQENLRQQDLKDNNQNWIVTGLAELGSILREYQSIESLSDGVTKYLYHRTKAINVKLFLHDLTNDELALQSAFAFERKKHLQKTIQLTEKNILTDTFKEKQKNFVKVIPENYFFIKSGLKEEKGPKSILVVPLIMDDKIFGILDLASHDVFTKNQIAFIVQISEIIARTIFNIRVNEQTRQLLKQSQELSSELEDQVTQVKNAQNRINILLQNASEVITIYDETHHIKYISPSVEHILGYQQSDLLEKRDIEFVSPTYRNLVLQMHKDLLQSKNKIIVKQFAFTKKDGSEMWLEATGKNMLDDPAIHGIVINKRDITERRRAEEEQRKRGQMQALSENSLDLITRIDSDGSFFYINPTIEALTGHKPDQYLNKKLDQVGLNEDVAAIWTHVIESVISSQEKKSCEMEFPAQEDTKIMMVNAIPEFDANEQEVESVLLVSHDITAAKNTENEIRSKNKKIKDSINYAERIQSTILPDNEILRDLLPNSFMLFRPRDLVSGDFPWIFQHGDDIILAAVDCTGHGVPGAMISLVGYFLLNEVVVGKGIYQPGEILNELDKLVTDTFRQNSESAKIKDGMDVAICRFNPKTGKLDYAGAHRPLYIVRTEAEEVEQLKGNKFPIGGGSAFKNKTEFTNYKADLNKGDAFYLFSDGLPDQFGGPQDRKLGPKRIRTFIQEKKGTDMLQMEKDMTQFLDDWQGEGRQFDDIIIFGVEY